MVIIVEVHRIGKESMGSRAPRYILDQHQGSRVIQTEEEEMVEG